MKQVSTDKLHYEPGETVLIKGSGFLANEQVTLQVRHHRTRRREVVNGKYKFDGLGYTPKLTTADTKTANCLATQLDNYNNGNPVALCP